MNVLFIKNISTEGPGSISQYLDARNMDYDVVEPERVGVIEGLSTYETMVVLGGPQAVYEMSGHHHMMKAAALIEQGIEEGMTIIGVCLGAQLIAHVLGARVYKGGAGQEIGWADISLTPEGLANPAMRAMDNGSGGTFPVVHWHGDTFDLPEGAERLAGSALYENQAFRYGSNVYALQFHVECTREVIVAWFGGGPDYDRVRADTEALYPGYEPRARGFYEHIFNGHINAAKDNQKTQGGRQ